MTTTETQKKRLVVRLHAYIFMWMAFSKPKGFLFFFVFMKFLFWKKFFFFFNWKVGFVLIFISFTGMCTAIYLIFKSKSCKHVENFRNALRFVLKVQSVLSLLGSFLFVCLKGWNLEHRNAYVKYDTKYRAWHRIPLTSCKTNGKYRASTWLLWPFTRSNVRRCLINDKNDIFLCQQQNVVVIA